MSFSGPEESIFWSMRGVAAVAAFLALALLPQCERSDRSESRTGRDQEPAAVSVVGFVRPDPKGTSIEELARMFDPALDTFDTEVLHVAVKERLKTLTKLVEDLEQIDIQHVADVVTDSFACPPLRPNELVTVFDDALIIVREPQPTADAGPSNSHSGAEGLVAALQELVEALGEGRDIRAKTKVFKIEKSEGFFSTQIFFEASNREAKVGRQVNATWSCSWEYPADEGSAKPRLKSIDIEKYEEIEVHAAGGVLFTDCTESAMGQNASYREQMLPGVAHWQFALVGVSFLGLHGITVGDVNGDGREDLYVCDALGLPNRLYIQEIDGTVTDRSKQSGTDWLEHTTAALLVDLDNDDDQDLVLSTRSMLLFSKNDGTGRFTTAARIPISGYPMSMCAADYDKDSDLDLYVCAYTLDLGNLGLAIPIPYHDANNGGRNRLLRNDGDFRFTDVTRAAGLDVNNTRFSYAVSWEDYDNDGDEDLYVANDFGRNNLYRNAQGHFIDVAAEAQVEDIATGMSVSWADYNRDGWMDVYVGNMYSGAGNRVSYQRSFARGKSEQELAFLQRTARGNTLFANRGDHGFDDVSEAAGVTMGRWAWASKFADLNNDGWEDLVVANGYLTMESKDDL